MLMLVGGVDAGAQLTVRVTDPNARPVRSEISFLIGDRWILAGQTDERGVYRRPERCAGTTPVRAEPLDGTYYPSSPQICLNDLRITVHPRSQPIRRLSFFLFDVNKDDLIDRIEWINLVAATTTFEANRRFTVVGEIEVRFNDRTIRARQALPFSATQQNYEIVTLPAYWRDRRIRLPSEEVTETFRATSGTVRPNRSPLVFYRVIEAYIGDSLAGSPEIESKMVRALNQTSLSFGTLDLNQDGYLSAAEAARARPVEEFGSNPTPER
jgi:hypothetical protein